MLSSVRAACACTSLPASGSRSLPRRARAPASRTMASGAPEGLSDGCKGAPVAPGAKLPIVGPESIMSPKAHGTSDKPVQSKLRWGCDPKLADRICWCEHLACGACVLQRACARARSRTRCR